MSKSSVTSPSIRSSRSEDQREFDKIKPFILQCLSLNHDINNPLAGVLGYTEYILSDPKGLSEDQIELLQKVMTCGERIQKLVADLGDAKAALAQEIDIKAVLEKYSE